MKHFKINVGRRRLSSEYIQAKQNFDSVLKGVRSSQPGIWKSPWFYGVVGMTSMAAIVGYYFYQTQNQINETIITQNNSAKEEVKQNLATLAVNVSNTQVGYASGEIAHFELKMEAKEKRQEKRVPETEAAPREEVPVLIPVQQVADVPVETEKKVDVKKKAVRNSLPSISGVYNGDISWENFKNGEVFVGEGLDVRQFSIQYTTRLGDKTISVKGSRIPDEIVSELENLGLNQTIFITNVIAGDETGELMRFVSMDLNLKFK